MELVDQSLRMVKRSIELVLNFGVMIIEDLVDFTSYVIQPFRYLEKDHHFSQQTELEVVHAL